MSRNPRTVEKGQEAADVAQWALALDSARQFGLVEGGPKVNVERCEEILNLAEKRGIRPHKDAVACIMRGMAGGAG